MTNKRIKEDSILIYHSFIEGDLQLSLEELYVYSYLYTRRTFEKYTEASIDTLSDKIQLLKVSKKNKARIDKIVEKLDKLNIIKIVEKEGETMTITFPKQSGGFVPVTYTKFKEFKNNPIQFFVYVAVAKWEGNPETGKARYSFSRWADLLQCCVKTAVNYINQACEDKVIYKKEGKRIEVNRQEINTYSIVPFPANGQVEEMTPLVEIKVQEKPTVQKEVNIGMTEMTPSELYEFITGMTQDDEFIEFMDKISRGKARYIWDELTKYKSVDDLMANLNIMHIYSLSDGYRTYA